VAAELTIEYLDPSTPAAPSGWSDFVHSGGLHPVWHWPVVRAEALTRRRDLSVGLIRDGSSVTGLVAARLRGVRGRPVVVDVEAPGSSAVPGIALSGGIPASLGGDPRGPAYFGAAVRALESTLRREFGRRVALVCYRQVYAEDLPQVMRGPAVVRPGAPVSVLRNDFADYDGYLRTLRKSRRVDQRRLVRRLDDDETLRIRLGPTPDDLDVLEVARLTDATSRRNHRRRWPPRRTAPPDLLRAMVAVPDVQVLSYRDAAGGLVGCGLTFDHPRAPLSGPWGARTPDDGGRTGLWFDQMARVVRWSIETGHAALIGGKGLSALKRDLGFVAAPQWTVVRRLPARTGR
jgi:hypothetical protein